MVVQKYTQTDLDFLLEENERKPTEQPFGKISEWVEDKRIMPANTPFAGFWRNDRTPYLVEIMDNMSPVSPIQHTVFMKAAQIGATAIAENIIGYYMGEHPAEILFISATHDSLERWSVKRLEPLIDSCKLRDILQDQSGKKKTRRTGDTTFRKEFFGGTLEMASAQSPAGQRADSKRILIRDEIDGAPAVLQKSDEGNWLEVSLARTNAWGARKKIYDLSTPTSYEDSQIFQLYRDGDQRKFVVPCPLCGKFQILEWGTDRSLYGIKADTENGRVKRVYYQCDHCHDAIFNHHKSIMLQQGKWEPTSESQLRHYRSYHISALYAPIGMIDWHEIYEKYQKTLEDPEGMKAFTNLILGEPYKEVGARPKMQDLLDLRGNYKSGTVQDIVLFLTGAVDVQTGSEKDVDNPPRLEMEICGHGPGYRTASVMYKVFYGDVTDPHSGAWEEFRDYIAESELKFYRKDETPFLVKRMFIDSGDGNVTDVVYRFCEDWQGMFPIKGYRYAPDGKGKKKAGDKAGRFNFKRYTAAQVGDRWIYEISTNYYKTLLYNALKVSRQEEDPQKPAFCDFPSDYPEFYFRMLASEEKRDDGSYHLARGHKRNEALDLRVYNMCAADVFLDDEVMREREKFLKKGVPRIQLRKITRKHIILKMKAQILPKDLVSDGVSGQNPED